MKIINTDGMAFIGPGSEWFWTAIGVLLAAVTLFAIYRQVRMQRGAAAFDQYATLDREWNSAPMARDRLTVLEALRDGADPARPPVVANRIANYWERVGYMVRRGYIDVGLVEQTLAGPAQLWWGWLARSSHFERERYARPNIDENFEWLAIFAGETDRKAGRDRVYDEAELARMLPIIIEATTAVVRAEEARAMLSRADVVDPSSNARRAVREPS
jgi:hypothetical protein